MEALKGVILILILLAAWEVGWWVFAGVKPISPWGVQKLLDDPNQKIFLADVRTKGEYALFHIPGSHHMPELLEDASPLAKLPEDTTVVMICMTGHRSSVAGLMAKKAGRQDVRSLTGGSLSWLITAHKVERGSNQQLQ